MIDRTNSSELPITHEGVSGDDWGDQSYGYASIARL